MDGANTEEGKKKQQQLRIRCLNPGGDAAKNPEERRSNLASLSPRSVFADFKKRQFVDVLHRQKQTTVVPTK